MIQFSERARIALDHASESRKARLTQIMNEVDSRRSPRSVDHQMSGTSYWSARVDQTTRMVYRITSEGVDVADIVDKARYRS